MFGYIKLDRYSPVPISENFRRHYCYLCRGIHKYYGNLPRFVLSYDVTVFSILLEPETYLKDVKKIPCFGGDKNLKDSLVNEHIHMCAALNVLLAEGQIEDNIIDSKSLFMKLAKLIFSGKFKKAGKEYPLMRQIIVEGHNDMRQIELNNGSVEEIENSFANLVGRLAVEVFKVEDKEYIEYLRYIGKMIYLLDAIDDLDKDIKKGDFNPLKKYGSKKDLLFEHHEWLENHLNSLKEPVHIHEPKDINILTVNRILYFGINEMVSNILKGVTR